MATGCAALASTARIAMPWWVRTHVRAGQPAAGQAVSGSQGSCPACHHRFPIACVITDDKRVHRVMLPLWVYRLWLQMATRNTPQLPSRENWSVEEEEAGPAPVGFIVNDVASVTCSDEILGRFHDQTISAWVEYEGVALCSSVRHRPGSLP
jgi:hypothetical protein